MVHLSVGLGAGDGPAVPVPADGGSPSVGGGPLTGFGPLFGGPTGGPPC